eukprot:TRINITY_DN1741_c0_g1_i4.p1 TRINITY_DN1741_c0_g1~~TRINITY_DN1741_c0_g1_i4.p1  ORF type:complete len:388 (+),score=141.14 TRINITY_DN1741_c0_g1_i4:55-1164(+)
MAFGGFGAFGGGFGGPGAGRATQVINACNDEELAQAPTEPISSLCWAPPSLTQQGKNFLAAGSWDKTVRVWEVQRNAAGQVAGTPVAQGANDQPVFDCTMTADGRLFYGGGCGTVKMMNMGAPGSAPSVVAKHDLPIKGIRWLEQKQILVTGGWDGKLKFWDCRQPSGQPGHVVDLGAPYVDMDIHPHGDLATIATARTFVVMNMASFQEVKRMEPHYTMREQLRCVANFPDKTGFAAGSIEGRVCVLWLDQPANLKDGKNFSFKCHREGNDVYSVNDISFHQQLGVFSTCGSDGCVMFWHKDQKSRLKVFNKCGNTIPCGKFDSTGLIYGYALSYDWTKGAAGYNPKLGHQLCLKAVQEDDVKPKKKR